MEFFVGLYVFVGLGFFSGFWFLNSIDQETTLRLDRIAVLSFVWPLSFIALILFMLVDITINLFKQK
jgi:hypothetical protein